MNTLRCRKPNGVFTEVTWQFFFANCPKLNQLCSADDGAWVAAITVCNQRLR
jgi:phage FluMu protein Com